MTATVSVTQIVSGGQTGVDRAALDTAIACAIPHGGWCPQGRRAEDGRIPHRYQLRETESSAYRIRTEQNILVSDATLILYRAQLQGGTLLTFQLCQRHDAPFLLVPLPTTDTQFVTDWLQSLQPAVLNVAGPRERTSPGIYSEAKTFLTAVLEQASGPN